MRLVTLTGPGGVGKTRLSVESAQAAAKATFDQICFVDLSPVHDPDLVITAIAQAMGVSGRSDTVPALLASIGAETRALLLIDNFEQVISAASAILELLYGAPGLKALVTSREPLKIDGEQEYPVAPLRLPTVAVDVSEVQISELDSVRLFVERARAVSPGFVLTADNALTVAEICRRLDGLPLAIELAAARVKVLPLPALLERLENQLPMLVGDRRDAPARQLTMRNAIAWGYSLLSDLEQVMFRRLGVFVGGFTLEAAEAIGTVGNPEFDVINILSSLVDKSLVRLDPAAVDGPRYVMLETIREFAREHLLASDEAASVRNAHAAGLAGIAVMADHVLAAERVEMVDLADERGVFIAGVRNVVQAGKAKAPPATTGTFTSLGSTRFSKDVAADMARATGILSTLAEFGIGSAVVIDGGRVIAVGAGEPATDVIARVSSLRGSNRRRKGLVAIGKEQLIDEALVRTVSETNLVGVVIAEGSFSGKETVVRAADKLNVFVAQQFSQDKA